MWMWWAGKASLRRELWSEDKRGVRAQAVGSWGKKSQGRGTARAKALRWE